MVLIMSVESEKDKFRVEWFEVEVLRWASIKLMELLRMESQIYGFGTRTKVGFSLLQ